MQKFKSLAEIAQIWPKSRATIQRYLKRFKIDKIKEKGAKNGFYFIDFDGLNLYLKNENKIKDDYKYIYEFHKFINSKEKNEIATLYQTIKEVKNLINTKLQDAESFFVKLENCDKNLNLCKRKNYCFYKNICKYNMYFNLK